MIKETYPFFFDPLEISEVRFWTGDEINLFVGQGVFTPNFEQEWQMYLDWQRRYPTDARDTNAFCAGDTFPDLTRSLDNENA